MFCAYEEVETTEHHRYHITRIYSFAQVYQIEPHFNYTIKKSPVTQLDIKAVQIILKTILKQISDI